METFINTNFGTNFTPAVTFTIYFVLILLAVLILIWLVRKLMGGTFVSGGRSRQQRLAIMDATPVDARRRLVLVRRDDVEHLILIGGPTDVVVEQNIRMQAPRQAQTPQQMKQEPESKRPVIIAPRIEEAVRPVDPATPRSQQPVQQVPPPLIITPAPRPIAPAAPMRPSPPIGAQTPSVAAPNVQSPVARAPDGPLSANVPHAISPVFNAQPAHQPVRVPPLATPTIAAAAIIKAPIVASPFIGAEPEIDLEESMFLDLSSDIGIDIDSKVSDISLEDEMERLLSTIDTKRD